MYQKITIKFLVGALLLIMSGTELFAQTKRIVFRPAATSATVTGRLGKGMERTFVLGARAGQRLSARVSSDGCIQFMDGGERAGYKTRAGSNYITIANLCGTGSSAFRLMVSIL